MAIAGISTGVHGPEFKIIEILRGEGAHRHEGADVVWVAHHTHLDEVVGRSLVSLESDKQAVHLNAVVQTRRGDVGVSRGGAIEIDGVAATVVLAAGGVGVERGTIVGVAGPTAYHMAGTGARGHVKVLRKGQGYHRHTRHVRCGSDIAAVLVVATVGTQTEGIVRVVGHVVQHIRGCCHRTEGSPAAIAADFVGEFPLGLAAAGSPLHRDVLRGYIRYHQGGRHTVHRRSLKTLVELYVRKSINSCAGRRIGRIRVGVIVLIVHSPVCRGGMGVEHIRRTIVASGVVIHNHHQVVGAVVGEVILEIEGVPSVGTHKGTFIYQCGINDGCPV